MNTILSSTFGQLTPGVICYPEHLSGFLNERTELTDEEGKLVFHIYGSQSISTQDSLCPHCAVKMHLHGQRERVLRHETKGSSPCKLHVTVTRFKCPRCHKTHLQQLPYECSNHRMTTALHNQIVGYLQEHTLTLKKIAGMCGIDPHTVKAIDKERLLTLYTDHGKSLKKPERFVRYLGIDEFKLHNGHQYATHIIDLDTGHILWIAFGKKKQVVYDFIHHVGMDWMKHVEAVAADMNAGFINAFLERCPWIQVVFDHFHVIKNFNDKVVSMVRKDEQRRLKEEGDEKAALTLKRCRYILTSSRATLVKKDKLARQGTILNNGSILFNKESRPLKGGKVKRYNQLLKENKLFFSLDLVKEALEQAFHATDEDEMAEHLNRIIGICQGTKNKHFEWFARLIETHWIGLVSHAVLHLSNGKIEGVNNRIKTVRRMGYGYPDDEYFFLKLIDMSRHRPT